jgi:hypothetical protein
VAQLKFTLCLQKIIRDFVALLLLLLRPPLPLQWSPEEQPQKAQMRLLAN